MSEFECFRRFIPRNDGFVKVRFIKFDDTNVLIYFLSILVY